MKKSIFIFVAILAAVIILGYIFRHTLYAKMDAFGLVPRYEGVTELYFDNFDEVFSELPHRIHKGTPLSFSFTVHNAEGKEMSIPYVVKVVTDGSTVTVKKGTLLLQDDEYQSVNINYVFKLPHQKAKFTVVLPDSNREIHFYVPKQ